MTYSIIARAGPRIGVAVASALPGVGGKVPLIVRGRGALCAQAVINPFWRPYGGMMLAKGAGAADIVRTLATPDPGRAVRQLLVLGDDNKLAVDTGAQCQPWCGHWCGDGLAVAGNRLAGPQVLAEMVRAYGIRSDLPLDARLLVALQAGEAAGGDRRGRRSAAVAVDHDVIAIDASEDPLADIARRLQPVQPANGLLSQPVPGLLA